jgi:hypothetical protein
MAVPNVPGVPPLLAYAAASSAITLLTGDLVTIPFSLFGGPQWGIFQNGAPVVAADSIQSVDFKKEAILADYPVEEGGFETYDKVRVPFEARVRCAAGSNIGNRQGLLDSIMAIVDDLNFYDVVTPEETYTPVNVIHYDYRRTMQNGVGLIIVYVWLREVIVAVSSSGSPTMSPQNPSSAAPQSQGQVQPAAATPVQQLNAPDVAAAGGIP